MVGQTLSSFNQTLGKNCDPVYWVAEETPDASILSHTMILTSAPREAVQLLNRVTLTNEKVVIQA